MSHSWQLLWGDDFALNRDSEQSIPLLFDSPYIAYNAAANLPSVEVGTWLHWEFAGSPGWIVVARYPVYRGKNLLLVAEGFEEQYKLSFLPAYSRTNPISFSFKIWKPTMPLYPRSSGSSESPSSAVAASAVAASVTAGTVLAANANRKGASIWNASTATLYLEMGDTVSATDYAVALGAGDYFEMPYGYTGLVSGVWTAANGNAMVREYT